jgi:hypothetical protein
MRWISGRRNAELLPIVIGDNDHTTAAHLQGGAGEERHPTGFELGQSVFEVVCHQATVRLQPRHDFS